MNELLTAMSSDMGIGRYKYESDDSFAYRLCYSALGQWCLLTAKNSSGSIIGTTKHNQTSVINELLQRYTGLFPEVADRFVDTSNQQSNFSVHIRRVYEETGYLLTDISNRNQLANFGRSIQIGCNSLLFAMPCEEHTFNGLGVFSNPSSYRTAIRDFLIRDDLTSEEYFLSRFHVADFYDKDLDKDELQFFNPLLNSSPSLSWSKKMETVCSVARKSEFGPFYRVMREIDNSLLFIDEAVEPQGDGLTEYEYRRLYFALKAHYDNPIKAFIEKKDDEYSQIRISGHLPNREYYFLLLVSWPVNYAFDKCNFLLKNDFIPEVTATLKHIGIDVKGGCTYD